jgi:tetratricopeptide (TPR) repeat protein
MGLYYDSRGNSADAEKNLVHALELQPDSQQILRDLTLFYIRQKQTDRAIQRISAVPDSKKQAFHYELMGLVYSQAGKLQDAENSFKKALEKDPSSRGSDVYLFSDYMKSGRVDDGLKKLDDIIKKNPSDGDAYQVKGQVYETQGRVEEAKKNYQEALKLNANSEVAANNLAFILAEQGTDLNTALSLAQQAHKKLPDNSNIADTLGWVYYKLGNYVLAREQVQFAASKEPDNGSYQYHLGMIYKQLKQTADAQAALKKAANTTKDFKEKSLAQAALKDIANLK